MWDGAGEREVLQNINRKAVDHDDKGIAILGGSGESRAFWTRGRGMPRISAHLEHAD